MEIFGMKQTVFIVAAVSLSVLFLVVGVTARIKRTKYNRTMTPVEKVISAIVGIVIIVVSIMQGKFDFKYNSYYDSNGKRHLSLYDMVYYDEAGNTYKYDFDKHGYDYLYKNGTDEKYDSNLCFVDENGKLFYDEFMNITAVDSSKCIDENGNIYYHAITAKFDKNGKLTDGSSVLFYGKDGIAYPYEPVPYVDEDGNKYRYSFDSETQKGYYTNVITEEQFENEYSFVDEEGWFVYDSSNAFVKQENSEYNNQYMDDEGNKYYWASGITWDEQGRLHDSLDRVIE